MNEGVLKQYEELKRNRNIINTIEPDFFFEIIDYLLQENELAKQALIKNCDIADERNQLLEENEKLKNKILDTLEGQKVIKEETPQYIKDNYIPKQKIKDKIEELKNYIYTGVNAPQDLLQYRIKAKIQGFQEFLEESEEK